MSKCKGLLLGACLCFIPLFAPPLAPVASAQQPAVADPKAEAGPTPIAGDPGSGMDKHAFGVLPNYRTANGSAPFRPITTRQKFLIATKDSFDGPSYGVAAMFSGLSQINNDNPSFGQGLKGYAHRYGTALIDQDMGNFLTEAVLPSLLHEDPRYFRKVNGSAASRVGYAVTRVVVTRTDTGGSRFNTSEVLGNGIVGAVGNLYYPDSRSFGDTMQRMISQIATDSLSGIMKEFWPDVKKKFLHKD